MSEARDLSIEFDAAADLLADIEFDPEVSYADILLSWRPDTGWTWTVQQLGGDDWDSGEYNGALETILHDALYTERPV